jgi:hypothetical protein
MRNPIMNMVYEFNGWGYYCKSDNILDLITRVSDAVDNVQFVQSPSLMYEYMVTRPDRAEQGIVELKCI